MESHVKILAWIYLIFGALGIVTGLFVWGVLGSIGQMVEVTGEPDADVAVPVLGWIGRLLAAFFAIVSLPSVIAGWGLLKREEWARILTIILSALNLPFVPLGTALGAYGLWVLLNNQTTPLFAKNA